MDPITIWRPAVTAATTDVVKNAATYSQNMNEILSAASTAAAALLAAGEPQGAPVLAIVPVLQALVAAYPPLAATSAASAQSAFV